MGKAAKPTIKSLVLDYIETQQTTFVDSAEFAAIRREVVRRLERGKAPADSYLMDILSATDVAIDRRLGGIPVDLRNKIQTGTLEDARASLLAMAREYAAADAVRGEDIRRAVRDAKDKIKFLLSRNLPPEKRRVKQEILRWMLAWLENPNIFESWVAIRIATLPKA